MYGVRLTTGSCTGEKVCASLDSSSCRVLTSCSEHGKHADARHGHAMRASKREGSRLKRRHRRFGLCGAPAALRMLQMRS